MYRYFKTIKNKKISLSEIKKVIKVVENTLTIYPSLTLIGSTLMFMIFYLLYSSSNETKANQLEALNKIKIHTKTQITIPKNHSLVLFKLTNSKILILKERKKLYIDLYYQKTDNEEYSLVAQSLPVFITDLSQENIEFSAVIPKVYIHYFTNESFKYKGFESAKSTSGPLFVIKSKTKNLKIVEESF